VRSTSMTKIARTLSSTSHQGSLKVIPLMPYLL